MAIREVLVLLDRENLCAGGIARRNPGNQQSNQIVDGSGVKRAASRQLLERLLRERERFLVLGGENAGRSIGPLRRVPGRTEGHEPSHRDVPNLTTMEIGADR